MNNQVCDLKDKTCVPCKGGMPPLETDKVDKLLQQVDGWHATGNTSIKKEFKYKNFAQALDFVNKVGQIAEQQGHHPDINLHNWNRVTVTLTTHAIKGLSENDFIVAAKIDELG